MNYRSALQILATLSLLGSPYQMAFAQNISPPDGAGADSGSPSAPAPAPSDGSTPAPAPAEGAAPAEQPSSTAGGADQKDSETTGDKEKTDKKAEEDSDEADKKKEEEEKRQAELDELSKKRLNDPVRQALFDLNSKQYDKCLATLDKVLSENPKHPQAHYVKAVAYVMTRQYPKAAAEYREVIRLVPNSDLGKRAEKGLKNLNF